MSEKPMQIELTAKKWKAAQLVSAVVMGVGVVWWYMSLDSQRGYSPASLVVCCVGLGLFFIARTLAWWFHE